jgi:hypothetical protein
MYPAGAAPLILSLIPTQVVAEVKDIAQITVDSKTSLVEEPWVGGLTEFSATPAPPGAFSGRVAVDVQPLALGILGRAVGSVHEPTTVEFWKKMFEIDVYVENILRKGY